MPSWLNGVRLGQTLPGLVARADREQFLGWISARVRVQNVTFMDFGDFTVFSVMKRVALGEAEISGETSLPTG